MTNSRFSFGPFVLDCAGAELRRGDEKVPLRPKCFDVLLHLVQQPGKLVTKDELLDQVWSDAVISEATLSRTVASLRAALEDDPESPKYIETISRRGYKFIGPVEETAADPRMEPGPRPRFLLIHGSREYPLRGEQIIGRGDDADILLHSSTTSRHHARITASAGVVTLFDLDSRHGTFVNGNRVSGAVTLEPGDEIHIGGQILTLWAPGSETAQ
jgi:DNA-binding winged helix-turn-helix (wHTH) protein